jgi:hypothetical protein
MVELTSGWQDGSIQRKTGALRRHAQAFTKIARRAIPPSPNGEPELQHELSTPFAEFLAQNMPDHLEYYIDINFQGHGLACNGQSKKIEQFFGGNTYPWSNTHIARVLPNEWKQSEGDLAYSINKKVFYLNGNETFLMILKNILSATAKPIQSEIEPLTRWLQIIQDTTSLRDTTLANTQSLNAITPGANQIVFVYPISLDGKTSYGVDFLGQDDRPEKNDDCYFARRSKFTHVHTEWEDTMVAQRVATEISNPQYWNPLNTMVKLLISTDWPAVGSIKSVDTLSLIPDFRGIKSGWFPNRYYFGNSNYKHPPPEVQVPDFRFHAPPEFRYSFIPTDGSPPIHSLGLDSFRDDMLRRGFRLEYQEGWHAEPYAKPTIFIDFTQHTATVIKPLE